MPCSPVSLIECVHYCSKCYIAPVYDIPEDVHLMMYVIISVNLFMLRVADRECEVHRQEKRRTKTEEERKPNVEIGRGREYLWV